MIYFWWSMFWLINILYWFSRINKADTYREEVVGSLCMVFLSIGMILSPILFELFENIINLL